MSRALVIHTGGIGDFLLAAPAIAAWGKGRGPVTLAGYPERLALGMSAGIAAELVAIDALDFSSIFSTPSSRLREQVSRLAQALVWMRDDDGYIAHALRAAGVGEVQCFPGLPPADWPRHASDYYAECLGFDSLPPLELALTPETHAFDVILHAGSGAARKNWPHFATLAESLRARGLRLGWSRGPAEEGLDLPRAEVLPKLTLVELAAWLRGARLVIGNDTGITHLAAATGTPTLAIFGPTDPRVWAPRGPRVRVAAGTPWPTLAEVAAAAFAMLEGQLT